MHCLMVLISSCSSSKPFDGTTLKLERRNVLTIMMEIIFNLSEVMGDIETMEIGMGWVDRLNQKIHKGRECHELVQIANTLRA